MFMRGGIINHRHSHSWALEKTNETKMAHFQHRFSVKTQYAVTGPFILKHHLHM
jgi:hypothetical protein